MNLSQNEIIEILGLSPHPTCGLVKQTYLSKVILPGSVLPKEFVTDRAAGSVLYFMVDKETKIQLHKIRSDQMYHFYFGSPLEVLLLYPNGNAEIKLMGHDLKAGMVPQLFIPANTFHIGRLKNENGYSLLGTSEWIGVQPEDVQIGDVSKLATEYPQFKNIILNFTAT